ncbi:SCO2521 family protein [Streptomyces varsoviensis]|uniref:SCO2521 family protein n=1 Tax=Streptomyces varsoviensis TaxID=67373 RepID=UPI0004CA320D|nr:SCO2521 family protein [Streptomyces varsoviensis]
MSAAAGPRAQVIACGEVRTCLLQTSGALSRDGSARLLRLRPDERVRVSERPNPYAVSPDLLTGVDCALPTASGRQVRGVGTVAARAVLTGGRVLQATALFRADDVGSAQRLPWGHYLVRPGVVVPVGRPSVADVRDGFLSVEPPAAGTVDLGAIAERLLTDVLEHPLLDRRPPFKSRRTRLRWAAVGSAEGDGDGGAVIERFTVADDRLRTLSLRLPGPDPAAAAAFCEDLALHDWLLTTLVTMVERSRLGSAEGPGAVLALRPAVDHLLHLWMPRARVNRLLAPLWDALEREPGFTRQWHTLVQRIRDQLTLQAIPLLCDALASS